MKILSMYLPQFHRVKENDEWWGEGFTEWTAVKKAKPLFDGHYQPHVPKDGYYNLLEKETMVHQSELMSKYGIDGMVFYHYWFENGRRILEKPCENLLNWVDVDMPFCFCWANETWARSWSNIRKKNVWADEYEDENKNKNGDGILLNQEYGNESEWRMHFEYILPYIMDKRYICNENGNPLFLIYKPEEIKCLNNMVTYWKTLCQKNGIKELYVIGVNSNRKIRGIDATLFLGPAKYLDGLEPKVKNGVRVFETQDLNNNIVNTLPLRGVHTMFGGFVGYDDTPRRGKNGTCINGFTADDFGKQLDILYQKNKQNDSEFIFINAWNEWGEGMHLEPDKITGFSYLEEVQRVKSKPKEDILFSIKSADDNSAIYAERDKFREYYSCFDNWLMLLEKGVCIAEYFEKKKIKEIIIYGWGPLGKHLYEELEGSSIKVKTVIDRCAESIHDNEIVMTLNEVKSINSPIVITPYYYFDEITQEIEGRFGKKRCISLDDIILELLK